MLGVTIMNIIHWPEILDAVINGKPIDGKKPGAPANETLSVPKILSWKSGELTAEWLIDPLLLNSRGELFGGYYSVLADVALSYTVMTCISDSERFKTIDLRVSYFRPAFIGKIAINCRVINKTKSFVHTEAEFISEEGKQLAKASATFAIVPA
jgi:uncharacterized protein (TIGR00369 family)